jgi:hypothetical protein
VQDPSTRPVQHIGDYSMRGVALETLGELERDECNTITGSSISVRNSSSQ